MYETATKATINSAINNIVFLRKLAYPITGKLHTHLDFAMCGVP
jgi:hypothetical protein